MKHLMLLLCLVASLVRADETPIETSMEQLLASPEKFQGKRVRVCGYLHLKFEDRAIYLTKDDADNHRTKAAFWISFEAKVELLGEDTRKTKLPDFDDAFVQLDGTFDTGVKGHLGAFAGGIDQITRLYEPVPHYHGKTDLPK
jgi:hypothetical protein